MFFLYFTLKKMEEGKTRAVQIVVICFLLFNLCTAMSRQQLKNSGKLMKKTCIPKNGVTEEQVGEIEQGKFIEDRNVMCYMACIYGMMQVVKNNKLNQDAIYKTVDMMFPPELKAPMKASTEKCFPITKQYKDLCEAAYYATKCMYDVDPDNFFFP